MNTPRRLLMIAAATSVALLGVAAVAQEGDTVAAFTPEIAITLRCEGEMASRERALGDFLKAHGLKTRDLSHSNDHSGRVFTTNAVFIGIDADRRIVTLAAHDAPDKDGFSLLLTAPASVPRGTAKLRNALEHFARHKFNCQVKGVHYGHNSREWAELYTEYARKIAKALRQ